YAATDNLSRSADGGATWSNNTLGAHPPYPATTPNNFISAMHKTGLAIGVSYQNPNKLYVSLSNLAQYDNDVDNVYVTGNPHLLYTLNASVATPAYVSIMSGLPNRFVTAMSVSPTFDDSIAVVVGGYGTSHVWISGNRGTTWVSRGTGLPDCPFNAI